MPKELDKPEAKTNFVMQVETVRSFMNDQMTLLLSLKKELEKAPAENLQQTIQAVLQIIGQVRQQNDQLSAMPLVSYTQSFLIEASKSVKIKLASGDELTGDVLMSRMMDGTKIQNSHEKIVDVIDKLTQFSRFVDPDLNVTK